MKYFYDLHIHTALSPCGDNDMTPNNIVNMSLLKELDIIAVTDHNICGNAEAVIKAAEGTSLLVIPGMEIETVEEVHNVCLFPNLESAKKVEQIILKSLPQIKNKSDVFGQQLFMDSEDEITDEYNILLLSASDIDIYSLYKIVEEHGGIAIPAHIDRKSYSFIANLGFIPDDIGINLVEISKNVDADFYFSSNKHLYKSVERYIQSSDAHYLHDISERINFFDFAEKPTASDVIKKLKAFC